MQCDKISSMDRLKYLKYKQPQFAFIKIKYEPDARVNNELNMVTWHNKTVKITKGLRGDVMSASQGSAVSCRLLHTVHRCCWQAASQVGHTANDGGATTSAIQCWPPSIHCARPHSLELLAGRPPRTAGLWVLLTAPENLAFLYSY